MDLSHQVTYTTLSEAANGDKTEVRVEDVTGLGTPYEIKPGHGVLRIGQPVNIVFKDYPSISIHLSLARDGTIVEVAPKIDVGQGKKTAFTQQGVKQAYVTLKKYIDKVSQQLSEAKTVAQNIENWLKSPILKSLQLRGMKKQQLDVLKNQTIPTLEQQMKDAQTQADVLQRLSQLVEQIHGTASIHLVIGNEAKDAGESNEDITAEEKQEKAVGSL